MNNNLRKKLQTDFTLYSLNDAETVDFYIKNMDYFVNNFPYFKDISLLAEYFISNDTFKDKFISKIDRFIKIVEYCPNDLFLETNISEETEITESTNEDYYIDNYYNANAIDNKAIFNNEFDYNTFDHTLDNYSVLSHTIENIKDDTNNLTNDITNNDVFDDMLFDSSSSFESSSNIHIELIKVNIENFPNHFPTAEYFKINKMSKVYECWGKVMKYYMEFVDMGIYFKQLIKYSSRNIILYDFVDNLENVEDSKKDIKNILDKNNQSENNISDNKNIKNNLDAKDNKNIKNNVKIDLNQTTLSEGIFKINNITNILYSVNNTISSVLASIYMINISRMRVGHKGVRPNRTPDLHLKRILENNILVISKIIDHITFPEFSIEMQNVVLKQLSICMKVLLDKFIAIGKSKKILINKNDSTNIDKNINDIINKNDNVDDVNGWSDSNDDFEIIKEYVKHTNNLYFNNSNYKTLYKIIIYIWEHCENKNFTKIANFQYKINLEKYLDKNTLFNSKIDSYTLYYIKLVSLMEKVDLINLSDYLLLIFKFDQNTHLLNSIFKILLKIPSLKKLKFDSNKIDFGKSNFKFLKNNNLEISENYNFTNTNFTFQSNRVLNSTNSKVFNSSSEEQCLLNNNSIDSSVNDSIENSTNDLKDVYFLDLIIKCLVEYAGTIYSGEYNSYPLFSYFIKLYNKNITKQNVDNLEDIKILLKKASDMDLGKNDIGEYDGFDRYVIEKMLEEMPYPSIFEE